MLYYLQNVHATFKLRMKLIYRVILLTSYCETLKLHNTKPHIISDNINYVLKLKKCLHVTKDVIKNNNEIEN